MPDSFDCTAAGALASVTLAKIVGKLWPHRCLDWAAACKAKAHVETEYRRRQEDEKERLVGNIASHLVNAQEFIQVQETTETRGRDVIIE